VLLVLLILSGVRLLGHCSVKDVLLISAASGRRVMSASNIYATGQGAAQGD
jgi:hypothetical protein